MSIKDKALFYIFRLNKLLQVFMFCILEYKETDSFVSTEKSTNNIAREGGFSNDVKKKRM